MQRILITGASGFVARHLAPYLAQAGFDVLAASRDATLRFDHPGISLVRLPVSPAEWQNLLTGVDGVVHLSGIAHRVVSAQEFDEVNHVLAAETAAAAQRYGVRHFVFVSSIAAQSGPTASQTLTEGDEPRPVDDYGRTKLAAENAIRRLNGPFTILRPVAISGEGAKGNLAALNRLARLPAPLPFGGFENRRSTLSSANFNSAVRTVLFNPEAMGETFIVADPHAMTVAEMIAKIRQRQGRQANLFSVSPRLVKLALHAIGKGPLWSRIGCPLVADPSKLLSLGWKAEDR